MENENIPPYGFYSTKNLKLADSQEPLVSVDEETQQQLNRIESKLDMLIGAMGNFGYPLGRA